MKSIPSPRAMRVCVLEDDTDLAEVMGAVLRSAGYEVDAHRDGRRALAQLRERPADLILLDLCMPDMNGWEFRAAQRADRTLEMIPVVVMTGDTSPQAAAIHADRSLRKPFSTDVLLSTVERVLKETARRQFAASVEATGRLAQRDRPASAPGHEDNNPLASALANLKAMEEQMPQLLAAAAKLESVQLPASDSLGSHRSSWGLRLMQEQLRESRVGLERVSVFLRSLQDLYSSANDEPPLVGASRSRGKR